MSLKTEQPRPGAVGQPSREAVRFFRRATLRGGLSGEERWNLVPVACSYKANENPWLADETG
jgi:hypothetical protein